jgi:hypothetical protein
LLDRIAAKIEVVELEQVKGAQGGKTVVTALAQKFEGS